MNEGTLIVLLVLASIVMFVITLVKYNNKRFSKWVEKDFNTEQYIDLKSIVPSDCEILYEQLSHNELYRLLKSKKNNYFSYKARIVDHLPESKILIMDENEMKTELLRLSKEKYIELWGELVSL